MSDEVTIDVGPVSCPACKRPYVSAPTLTEEEVRRLEWAVSVAFPNVASERDAALASLRRLSGSTSTGGPTDERFPNGYPEDPVLGPYEDAAGGPSDG